MTENEIRTAVAQGTLARRIKGESARLGEMLRRGNHAQLSYQSGLVDGLTIAARLTGLEVQDVAVKNGGVS